MLAYSPTWRNFLTIFSRVFVDGKYWTHLDCCCFMIIHQAWTDRQDLPADFSIDLTSFGFFNLLINKAVNQSNWTMSHSLYFPSFTHRLIFPLSAQSPSRTTVVFKDHFN
ncbi:hypothetical protein GOODEAATRI_006508 [Goodea atripinnis]|uniref:Uncharacterized protein n=1 Tax=Goodea atripinnis TaxID=208336 RepID=A0ABV0MZF4_9TELE